jgi:hypothetical protein
MQIRYVSREGAKARSKGRYIKHRSISRGLVSMKKDELSLNLELRIRNED